MKKALNPEGFFDLFKWLKNKKFEEIPKRDLLESAIHSGVKKFVRGKEGIEKCFRGYFNESEVIVCTTWSDLLQKPKKSDTGWVLSINKYMEEPLYSKPIRRRSDNFFLIMKSWVSCLVEIAEKWPSFPNTNVKLLLVRVKGLIHMRKFIPPTQCGRYIKRKPYTFWLVEMDLSIENSKFLIQKYGSYYKYRIRDDANRIEAGKEPRSVARVNRYNQKHGVQHSDAEGIDPEPNYDVPD